MTLLSKNKTLSPKVAGNGNTGLSENNPVDYNLILTEYKITYDPIYDENYTPQVRRLIETLFTDTQKKPREMIPELKSLIKMYPHVPQFYNYLGVAYEMIGNRDKMVDTVMDACRLFPDYLFAKINMANICIRTGDYDLIPPIFNHKYELKMLYPNRNIFHVSEVVSFYTVMGLYFCGVGNIKVAEKYYEVANELAPNHPNVKKLKGEIKKGKRKYRLKGL